MKRIVFLTHANPQGYRIQQYFPYLAKRGFEVELITTRTGFLKILPVIRSAHAVYIQRLLFDPIKFALLRASAKRLIYDFDDAVMYGSKGISPTRARKFRNMVSKADLVLAGNHFLLQEAKKYKKNGVFYVPTVVDINDYPVKTHIDKRQVIAGWIGSASTLKYLDIIKLLISDKQQPVFNVVFKVIADRAPEMEGDMVFERWTKEREKDALLSLDIGVMPLTDDIWSKGKCGLKLIQYMAAGLPSVTHPVGVTEEMIQDGVNGFLRSDIQGWRSAIEGLSKDVDLRRNMGMAAREVAADRYSLHVWGPRVSELIDSL